MYPQYGSSGPPGYGQPTYPPQSGYPPQTGYPPQSGYPQQSGYPSQYGFQPDAQQPSSYPSQSDSYYLGQQAPAGGSNYPSYPPMNDSGYPGSQSYPPGGASPYPPAGQPGSYPPASGAYPSQGAPPPIGFADGTQTSTSDTSGSSCPYPSSSGGEGAIQSASAQQLHGSYSYSYSYGYPTYGGYYSSYHSSYPYSGSYSSGPYYSPYGSSTHRAAARVDPIEYFHKMSTVAELPEEARGSFLELAGVDGEIDAFELKDILNKVFERDFKFEGFNSDMTRSMVAMRDYDMSGKLNFDDFKRLWSDIVMCKRAFMALDTDGSGAFNKREFGRAVSTLGMSPSEEVVSAMVLRYSDKDGNISFDDFVACYIKLKTMMNTFKSKDLMREGHAVFEMDEYVQLCMYA